MEAAEIRTSKPDLLRVDVAMITYNQEAYIAQAIESVLAQKTTFPVRMVIGEDCSTDNTRAIIQQYAQRYPERFLLLLPDTNQGVMKNLRQVLETCDAPYVAILEGDDYWCDENKLQKQIDLLMNNREISFCFHDAIYEYQNEQIKKEKFSEKFSDIILNDRQIFSQSEIVLKGWFIPTASILFRNCELDLPKWFDEVYSGDTTLHLLLTRNKKCIFLSDVMSVYRIHDGSISITLEKKMPIEKGIVEKIKFKNIVDNSMHNHLDILLSNLYLRMYRYKKNNNESNSFAFAVKGYSLHLKTFLKRVLNKILSI